MKKVISVTPVCDTCGTELAILEIQIDFVNCAYVLFCECISCGAEITLVLSLEDFVTLNQLGGCDENNN